MVDVKNIFERMDLDTSFFSLPKTHYVDGLNITRDSFTASQDMAVTNIVGNRLVNYTLPAGTNKVIGGLGVLVRNTVIYCVYNSNNRHSVLEYNNTTRTISKVFENITDSGGENILTFNTIELITSINVYIRDDGDLLFFLDSLGRPTMMNITRFKAGEYTPVTRQIINLHKMPPLSPPDCVYDNDSTVDTNDLRNKLFRFKYRWIYDDDFKSTWSPISAVPLPSSILDPTFTNDPNNNNVIRINMNSGEKNVKQIELAVSFVNKVNEWPIFQSVVLIDKEQESIDDDIAFNYNFYNDSTYPIIDVEESNLLFDWIPRYAQAQEMPNGNYLVFGGVEEGYDRDLDPNVTITILTEPAGGGGAIGSLNGVVNVTNRTPPLFSSATITFSGIPATGTVVNVYLNTNPGGVPTLAGTYTTLAGDTSTSVAAGLEASMLSLGIVEDADSSGSLLVFLWDGGDYTFGELEINPPTTDTDNESIATWKWSTSRNIGIIYYDENGVTNGVLYSAKIVFPPYAENVSDQPLLPYINVKIYHVPPIWAYSYQFVITKEPTTYLFWECIDVNDTETDYIYFDVSNISINSTNNPTVASVLSYSFQDGDRMRLIRRMSDGTVYTQDYDAEILGQVVDPTINGTPVTGTFIKIANVAPFAVVDYTSNFFVIEIYRPGKQPPTETNQAFFEFGEQYPILNPGTSTRVHGGQVTNQSTDYVTPAEVNLRDGDSYFRSRTVYISDVGFGTFNVQDRNFVDFYTSAVSSIDGRAVAIELNAKSAFYGATIRHSEPYQPNTNINGLNRFYPESLLDCDLSYGNIGRLKVRDRYMRVFQKLKVGAVALFNQISKDNAGNEITVQTGNLLNPIQYYVGDWGIGTAKGSLASYNYADYFADNIRGVILRLSNDGNTPISVLYKVNSWAVEELTQRGGTSIFGAYDQRSNNFILAIEAAGSSSAQTIAFDEETNAFEGFLSYNPDFMVSLGTLLISFKNGSLYTHDSSTYNQFYGVDYESSITLVFNDVPLVKKTPLSIAQNASTIWDCPEIYSNVMSFGSQRQETNLVSAEFLLLEQMPTASIKRNIYSVGGKINGQYMKGNWLAVKFRLQDASDLQSLSIAQLVYNQSPLNKIN